MAYIGTLAVNVVANTARFQAGLKTANRNVSTFTGSIQKASHIVSRFGSMLGVGIGVGGAAGLIKMAKGANEFEGAMNRSLAIMSDVSAKMRREMELTAHSVAYNSKYSAKEAAEAYFFLASAGMSAKQSLAALPVVTRFAQAGNFDLALATDLATDAQSALGLRVKDNATNLRNLQYVTDTLVKANTVANASVQQFSESLTNKAGAAMRMYGVEVADGMAMLAAFADQGVKGADAGTRFDIVMRDLTTKAILNAKAFEKAGVSVYDFSGALRKPQDIIRDLEVRLGGLSVEGKKAQIMMLGFADKSASATASLLGYSKFMGEVSEQMRDVDGTTEKVADNLTKMDAAWQRLSATLGKISSEVFPPILDQMADMADGISGISPSSADKTGWEKFGEDVAMGMEDWLVWPKTVKATFDAYNKIVDDFIRQAKTGERIPATELLRPELETLFGAEGIEDFLGPRGVGIDPAKEAEARERHRLSKMQGVGKGQFAEESRMSLAATDKMKATTIAMEEAEQERQKWADMHQKTTDAYNKQMIDMDQSNIIEEQRKRVAEWNKNLEMSRHIIDSTRTPLERFKADLADINRLMEIGALTDPVAAARKVLELKKSAIEEMRAGEIEPGLTPAMTRGSLAAHEAIARATMPEIQPRREAEEQMLTFLERLEDLPYIRQAMETMERKQSKPGTVEVAE